MNKPAPTHLRRIGPSQNRGCITLLAILGGLLIAPIWWPGTLIVLILGGVIDLTAGTRHLCPVCHTPIHPRSRHCPSCQATLTPLPFWTPRRLLIFTTALALSAAIVLTWLKISTQ
ncbi:MAG: hypothetical protein ACYS26_13415 [Planctomycetota bacterium]|jgi:hypothetical protein